MTPFLEHLKRWRPLYVFLPVSVGLLVLALYGSRALTGRAATLQPDVMVEVLYGFIRCVLGILLAFFVKILDTLNRPAPPLSSWQETAVSRAFSMGLIISFLWFLSH